MEQVSSSTAQSTQQPQTQQEVEAILARADRQSRPSRTPHYNDIRGHTCHDRKEYELGTIIVAGPMFEKNRPAIVVAQHPNSNFFLVVPMLTYNGNGLQGKDPRVKAEHMSICDQREGGWYQKQNDMPVLLTDLDMKGSLMRPESVIRFTKPFKILYGRATKILGKLCEYSTQILLEQYQKSATRRPRLVRGPMQSSGHGRRGSAQRR